MCKANRCCQEQASQMQCWNSHSDSFPLHRYRLSAHGRSMSLHFRLYCRDRMLSGHQPLCWRRAPRRNAASRPHIHRNRDRYTEQPQISQAATSSSEQMSCIRLLPRAHAVQEAHHPMEEQKVCISDKQLLYHRTPR